MNYYKRNIGDIARDLSNLSQGAMGAYDLLMDWYYANEKPLPSDPEDIYNITRARTKDERKNAAKARAFFDADGRHARCDEEIAKYRAQAEANRITAEAREERKRATNRARPEHESCTNGSPNAHCEPSHKPLATTSKNTEENTHPEESAGTSGVGIRPEVRSAILLNALGCRVTPANPDLLAAMSEGVQPEDLEALAKLHPGKPAGYVLQIARRERAEGAKPTPQARAGPPQAMGKTATAIHALEGMKHGNKRPDLGTDATVALPGPGRAASG